MTAHSLSILTPRIARGGKTLYGAPLGILMLEANFPRIPGDMGNGTTWPFPVLYRVVSGASPEKVVLKGAAGLAGVEGRVGVEEVDRRRAANLRTVSPVTNKHRVQGSRFLKGLTSCELTQMPWH